VRDSCPTSLWHLETYARAFLQRRLTCGTCAQRHSVRWRLILNFHSLRLRDLSSMFIRRWDLCPTSLETHTRSFFQWRLTCGAHAQHHSDTSCLAFIPSTEVGLMSIVMSDSCALFFNGGLRAGLMPQCLMLGVPPSMETHVKGSYPTSLRCLPILLSESATRLEGK